MKIPKLKTQNIDVTELAIRAVGIDKYPVPSFYEIENALCENLDVSYEQFEKVVAALLPFTTLTKSPRGENHYRIGFVNHEEVEYMVMVEFQKEKK